MKAFRKNLQEVLRYPSAIIGLVIIFLLVVLAVYAVVSIPYREAIRLWRGGEDIWYANPKLAAPAWINFFRTKKLPVSFHVNSAEGQMDKVVTPSGDGSSIVLTYSFDFQADGFPQELMLYFDTKYEAKQPFVSISFKTPDGREFRVSDTALEHAQNIRFSQETKLLNKFPGTHLVMEGLFADSKAETLTPLKGEYTLVITAFTFEKDSDVNLDFVFHGQVYGIAGTDMSRRDLIVPLLWGAPIALGFGLFASLGTSVITMMIAALAAWYGGWVDELIQRITEVNMVLPFLPILIMIGTFFSRSIFIILGAVVLLSIFTGQVLSLRAVFMQVRESPYIEAARAYGASNGRIIFRYMVPRMIPLLVPGLVSGVPSFIFFEATLSVLGLGDPTLPTWGKIINDAEGYGALYKGLYYWILEPAILLMITGLGFAMLGFALDRIFNPRLRGM